MPTSRLIKFVCLLGAAAALATAVIAWVGAGVAEATLALAPGSEEADEFLASTEMTIEEARRVLDAVATVSDNLAGSSEQAIDSFEALADLTEREIPAALGAVEQAIPALIDTAAVIDTTMSALARLGIPYDPEVPLVDSLVEFQAALAGLPATVQEQGAALREMIPDLRTATDQVALIPGHIQEMESSLGDAQAALSRYRDSLDATTDTVAPSTAFAVIRVAAAVLAMAGIGLGFGGWRLASRVDRIA